MNLKKALATLIMFAAPWVTSGIAQVFWSNQSPTGITDDIWCVTYANGTFAAVTNQGNLLTSHDGLTWSSQHIDQGVWLVSIAYGNGTWVVVGDKGTILVSSDLRTWIHATSNTTVRLNGVLNNGIVFIAVGESGTILTSADGQKWASQPSGVTGYLHGITYEVTGSLLPYTILVSGQNGLLLEGLGNGTSFTQVSSGTSQNLEAVNFQEYPNPLITVAVGGNGAIIDSTFTQFSGGLTWSGSWAIAAAPKTTVTFRGLTFGNGYFVAAGDLGTIMTSSDGVNWTQRFSGDSPSSLSTAALLSAAYSQDMQRFVVTGTGGTILASNSPPTTFGNVSTRGYVTGAQTFIGGFVLEGTASRTVLIRADGPVLSSFNVPGPLPDPVLTVYNASGTVIATNTGWTTLGNPALISTAALNVGAFALPNPSTDSALLLTLQPGAYTVQITSAKGNSGTVLFEAYTD